MIKGELELPQLQERLQQRFAGLAMMESYTGQSHEKRQIFFQCGDPNYSRIVRPAF